MAAEMFSCEFDRYDKKQRPCNLYTLVGVLMALLESIFSAANSFAGLVEAAIFVLDEPTRSARAAGSRRAHVKHFDMFCGQLDFCACSAVYGGAGAEPPRKI